MRSPSDSPSRKDMKRVSRWKTQSGTRLLLSRSRAKAEVSGRSSPRMCTRRRPWWIWRRKNSAATANALSVSNAIASASKGNSIAMRIVNATTVGTFKRMLRNTKKLSFPHWLGTQGVLRKRNERKKTKLSKVLVLASRSKKSGEAANARKPTVSKNTVNAIIMVLSVGFSADVKTVSIILNIRINKSNDKSHKFVYTDYLHILFSHYCHINPKRIFNTNILLKIINLYRFSCSFQWGTVKIKYSFSERR